MMQQPPRIHLFQGYGIELEYMMVDCDTLKVKPITDELIKHETGAYQSDFENGIVTWSNELVLHVVELKSTRPEHNFNALENAFAENVKRINAILAASNTMLMPTAAHPFMDPLTETKIWPHENNEVYDIYNRIFDCRGHGWSNLQSTHLNLPFYDDEEFAKLHAAVRLVLPILPALCASSPILDGKLTGMLDTRLKYYKTNQAKIPSITGKVIPEAIFSKRNYLNNIYEKIKSDIAPYDPGAVLNPIWVNSRGAIPRFDRGSIEIRIMDIQECPAADMAILTLVIETIKSLVHQKFIDFESQMKWKTDFLAQLLDKTSEKAGRAVVDNPEFLNVFGFTGESATAIELWRHITDRLMRVGNTAISTGRRELDVVLSQGALS
ncbi:MAG: glutamate-cysteine ligase family protein, partial [Bacteroidota bacterium]|nr:glutamate-cysteine ligase family protein [Bacteroidota bacterium]